MSTHNQTKETQAKTSAESDLSPLAKELRLNRHLTFVKDYSEMESITNTELVVGRSIAQYYNGPKRSVDKEQIKTLGYNPDAIDMENFSYIEDYSMPLGSDKRITLKDVIIDKSHALCRQGTVIVADEKGNTLELKIARPGGYPQYSFNGQNLNSGIQDRSPAMAVLAQKWGDAMTLYPAASFAAKKAAAEQNAKTVEEKNNEIRKQLDELGLTSF